MNKNKTKRLYVFIIFVSIIVIAYSSFILYRAYGPRPDYETFYSNLSHLSEEISNIESIEMISDGVIYVYIDDSSWVGASNLDKASYCKNINELITAYCQKDNIINSNQIALVYYYNDDGIVLAEPKTLSLESNILY